MLPEVERIQRLRTRCPWQLGRVLALIVMTALFWLQPNPAHANTCAPATSQGTAPSDFQNYCWFNFSGYDDAMARSGGQNFVFNLPDGSTLSFTLNVSSAVAGTALHAAAVPSWPGAAFGNQAFLGIPGYPVLYESNSGSTVDLTLSNIQVTPPSGSSTAQSSYAIIAADGESTNNGESLSFTTNGSPWQLLAKIPNPVSGSTYYPTLSGVGTSTVTEKGTSNTYASSYVFGSLSNPTQVSSVLVGGGLQGIILGVRFASISVTTVIKQQRVAPSDQFQYGIALSGGALLTSQTTSGSGLGPFPDAGFPTIAASYPFVVRQSLASGSASTLANYATSLTCTNASTHGSSTPLPTNAAVTQYTFPSLQFGDAINCTFTETPYPSVAGIVYSDLNANGQLDPGETGTGVAGLFVKLADSSGNTCQTPAIYAASVNPTTGAYSIPGVPPGSYCLILDANNTLTDITPSVPGGWIGTEAASGVRDVAMGTQSPTSQNFGLFHGSLYQGTVFDDDGAGGGTANNGAQDGAEAGLANITVNASVAGKATASALTAGNGTYTLFLPSSVTGSVDIEPSLGSSYVATGGSAGTSNGVYTRPNIVITPASGEVFRGMDFGAVPVNTLNPNGALTGSPGTTVYFPHSFIAGSTGSLTLATAANPAPAVSGWTETLYLDTNCNGQIDVGEPAISGPISVVAGQRVCVVVKQFIPSGAPLNAQNQVQLTAAFAYANTTPGLDSTLENTDTTTVTVAGALKLIKQVTNLSQHTPVGTANSASPGDTLEYELTLSNPGAAAVNSVSIADNTPAFTSFLSASCPATAALPTGITGCAITTQPATGSQGSLLWSFSGHLAPGAVITVSYQVEVSP